MKSEDSERLAPHPVNDPCSGRSPQSCVSRPDPRPSYKPNVLGHVVESAIFNGDAWEIICSCMWECVGQPSEDHAWELFNDHVFDDVNTVLSRQRDETRKVIL